MMEATICLTYSGEMVKTFSGPEAVMRSTYASGWEASLLMASESAAACSTFRCAAGHVGCEEADVFKYPFHDGVQAARADVLSGFVDLECELGHFAQSLGSELQAHTLGFKQR